MNVPKKLMLVLSLLAVMLLPVAPAYAASDKGLANGQGKGLYKTEPVYLADPNNQNSATENQTVNLSETKTLVQTQSNVIQTNQNNTPQGNNGTLKIHEQGTPSGTENNDPKVCSFNVEGFGFDAGQTGYIQFTVQGGDKPTGQDAGPYPFGPTDLSGFYATEYFSLVDGHYKATLYGKMLPGGQLDDIKAKSKVFKVICDEVTTESCPTGTTWNDKNNNQMVDPGECTTTAGNPDENGEVLSASTTQPLANTGENVLAVVLTALNVLIATLLLAHRAKKTTEVNA